MKMFGGLRKLAAPGATLIVLTVNRDFIVRHFQPVGIEEAGDVRIVQRRRFDIETSRIDNIWEFYRRSKGVDSPTLHHLLSVEMDHRLYSLHELTELLESVGWTARRAMGQEAGPMLRLGAPSVDSPTIWISVSA